MLGAPKIADRRAFLLARIGLCSFKSSGPIKSGASASVRYSRPLGGCGRAVRANIPGMLIREAKPEEADDLTRLAVRSKRAWGYDDDFMWRVMPDMIVHRQYLIAEHGIVAEEAGMPIGYAIVSVEADSAFLRDLFVEPDRFRQGIGTALFGEAVRFAREQGAESITLGGDPNAIGFYERMGMRQIGYEPSIVGNGRMLPIMTLDIT